MMRQENIFRKEYKKLKVKHLWQIITIGYQSNVTATAISVILIGSLLPTRKVQNTIESIIFKIISKVIILVHLENYKNENLYIQGGVYFEDTNMTKLYIRYGSFVALSLFELNVLFQRISLTEEILIPLIFESLRELFLSNIIF